MLTEQNEYIKEASATIYQLSQEEAIRQQCEAREDYYRRQRTMQYYVDKATADLAAAEQKLAEAELRAEAAEAENAALKALIAQLQAKAEIETK